MRSRRGLFFSPKKRPPDFMKCILTLFDIFSVWDSQARSQARPSLKCADFSLLQANQARDVQHYELCSSMLEQLLQVIQNNMFNSKYINIYRNVQLNM